MPRASRRRRPTRTSLRRPTETWGPISTWGRDSSVSFLPKLEEYRVLSPGLRFFVTIESVVNRATVVSRDAPTFELSRDRPYRVSRHTKYLNHSLKTQFGVPYTYADRSRPEFARDPERRVREHRHARPRRVQRASQRVLVRTQTFKNPQATTGILNFNFKKRQKKTRTILQPHHIQTRFFLFRKRDDTGGGGHTHLRERFRACARASW